MPHSQILFGQLQQQHIDVIKIKKYIENFQKAIQQIRDEIDRDFYAPTEGETLPDPKRRRVFESNSMIAKEVCDIIISNVTDRFTFTGHLSAAILLQTDLFSKHHLIFPLEEFNTAVQCYNLHASTLKHELTVIYGRKDFSEAVGCLALLQFFVSNNLLNIFPETHKLLQIICTIPMTTTESERCFSTLKRIKTFSRNTMKQDRLSALAMCSIEKRLIQETNDFNELVIDHFVSQKERRVDFIYKHY